jgi:hypothetical protein
LEKNIYFVIQPLQFLSRIIGLSPFHIDPNYTYRNKGGYIFCHIIQAIVMIILLLCGLCTNVLILVENNEPAFKVIARIVWIFNILVSNLTSILALLFYVTRNRNHIRNVFQCYSVLITISFVMNQSKMIIQNRDHT